MKLISCKVESESYIMPCKWFKTPPLVTKKSKENFTLGFFLLYVVFVGCSNFFVFYIITVVLYSCHPFRCSLSSFGYIFYLSYLMMVDPFLSFFYLMVQCSHPDTDEGLSLFFSSPLSSFYQLPPPSYKTRTLQQMTHNFSSCFSVGFPVKHLFPRKIFSSKKTLFKLITTFMFRFLPD